MAAVARVSPMLEMSPLQCAASQLLRRHLLGDAALPSFLGLGEPGYRAWLSAVFGDPRHDDRVRTELQEDQQTAEGMGNAPVRWEIRELLLEGRRGELADLASLLMSGAAADTRLAQLSARVIACACLSEGHLWKALGLNDRGQLRTLLSELFPELVERNVADMRWKRFFYRQLCERGGDYLCRAPTCGECSSHAECFVTETTPPPDVLSIGRGG